MVYYIFLVARKTLYVGIVADVMGCRCSWCDGRLLVPIQSFVPSVVDVENDADDVFAVRVRYGHGQFDEQRAADYDLLLKRFVAHRRSDRRSHLERLPAPPVHIWTSASTGDGLPVYDGQEPVRQGRLRLRESLIRDARLHPVHERIVRRIDWPDGGSIFAGVDDGETP